MPQNKEMKIVVKKWNLRSVPTDFASEVLFLDAQNWALLIKLPKFSRSKLALQVLGCKIQDHSFMPKSDGTYFFITCKWAFQ